MYYQIICHESWQRDHRKGVTCSVVHLVCSLQVFKVKENRDFNRGFYECNSNTRLYNKNSKKQKVNAGFASFFSFVLQLLIASVWKTEDVKVCLFFCHRLQNDHVTIFCVAFNQYQTFLSHNGWTVYKQWDLKTHLTLHSSVQC